MNTLPQHALETLTQLSPGTHLKPAVDINPTASILIVPLPTVKLGAREFYGLELVVIYDNDWPHLAKILQPYAPLLMDHFSESSGAVHPHIYNSGAFCIARDWDRELLSAFQNNKPTLGYMTAVKAISSLNTNSQTRHIPKLTRCVVCKGYHGIGERTHRTTFQGEEGVGIGDCVAQCELSNGMYGKPELKEFRLPNGRKAWAHASLDPVHCRITDRLYDRRQTYICPATGMASSPWATVFDSLRYLVHTEERDVNGRIYLHAQVDLIAVLLMLKPMPDKGAALRFVIASDLFYARRYAGYFTKKFLEQYDEFLGSDEWRQFRCWMADKSPQVILDVLFPGGWRSIRNHRPPARLVSFPDKSMPVVSPVEITWRPSPVDFDITQTSQYRGERIVCADCDDSVNEDDAYYLSDGTALCEGCRNDGPYSRCDHCEELFHTDDLSGMANDREICDSCYNYGDYGSCEGCDAIYHGDDLHWCEEHNVYVCDGCGIEVPYVDGDEEVLVGTYLRADTVPCPIDIDATQFEEVMNISVPSGISRGEQIAQSLYDMIREFQTKLLEMGSEVPEDD